MKVILLQDVKSLGKKDAIVEVSDGYGQNYLIPRKLAVVATAGNMNEVKQRKESLDNKAKKELEAAKEYAAKLNDKVVTIYAKVGENGKLFGAISNKDIQEAIKKQYGLDVDKKKIVLNEPIKTVGSHIVEIKLYTGVNAKITVKI